MERTIELINKADVSEEKAISIFTEGLTLLTESERMSVTKAVILKSKKGTYVNFVC